MFVCIHNSARSQMAAAFLSKFASDRFEVESAGLEPGRLNPVAVEVMRESGIDISRAKTQSVFDLFKAGRRFAYVISVCDGAAAERCPIFPGVTKRLGWTFEDPSSFEGTHEERIAKTRVVRDQIRDQVLRFIDDAEEDTAFGRVK